MFSLDLQPGERLFKIYRQSEWVLAKPAIIISFGIYIPAWLLIRNELMGDYNRLFLIWAIGLLIYGLNRYLLWLINSYVVTDKRLVAIRYQTLFEKRVIECPLNRILNVSYATTGFFSSMLNFGNVEIQVSGLPHPLVFERLKKPANMKNFLWALQAHERDGYENQV